MYSTLRDRSDPCPVRHPSGGSFHAAQNSCRRSDSARRYERRIIPLVNAGRCDTPSQFSGNETLIDMAEIPGGGAADLPPNNWDRTIKGVRFLGGAELGIGGRVPGEINSNPFQGTPAAGDPAGFQGACLRSWFTLYAPLSDPFSLDFQLSAELPKRVVFIGTRCVILISQSSLPLPRSYGSPTPRSKRYTFAPQSTRLIAFEEDRGIESTAFFVGSADSLRAKWPANEPGRPSGRGRPERSSLFLAPFGIASAAAGLGPTTRRSRLPSCFRPARWGIIGGLLHP
jgi:hypothetical protein